MHPENDTCHFWTHRSNPFARPHPITEGPEGKKNKMRQVLLSVIPLGMYLCLNFLCVLLLIVATYSVLLQIVVRDRVNIFMLLMQALEFYVLTCSYIFSSAPGPRSLQTTFPRFLCQLGRSHFFFVIVASGSISSHGSQLQVITISSSSKSRNSNGMLAFCSGLVVVLVDSGWYPPSPFCFFRSWVSISFLQFIITSRYHHLPPLVLLTVLTIF